MTNTTYLVISEISDLLIAYYTLSSTSILYTQEIDVNDSPVRVESGFPTIQIKMFAVSESFQDTLYMDKEYGEILISDLILGAVIGSIYTIAIKTAGATMIFLYSIDDEEVKEFYRRNKFLRMEKFKAIYDDYSKNCIPMWMTLFDLPDDILKRIK